MRVCVVTTAFPHLRGHGEGAFVWESARAAARRGCEVHVLAMDHPDAAHHEVWDNVEIWRPSYWLPRSAEALRRDVGGLPINWKRYPMARVQVMPLVMVQTLAVARLARHCDVIHAHWTFSAAAARLSQVVHQRPILATLQGSDIFQATKLPMIANLTRWALKGCSEISVLSSALKQATEALATELPAISIIPNGVDLAEFRPVVGNEKENVILYVGSLIERKGVHHLLPALPDVLRDLPDYRLVIVGDGPKAQELRAQARQLGIQERVDFTGFLPQSEVRQWMRRARLLVLPSLEEGLGVVLLEALASGTPIVASRVGGIVDVVSEDVGTLVPPADSRALSVAITELLTHPKIWMSKSQAARARAENQYSWDQIANAYVSVYSRIVAA